MEQLMTLLQLKEWLETIPPAYNETQLVFRTITQSADNTYTYVHDNPITACGIDIDNLETFFVNHESALLLSKI